jgi:uncharacterized membrane protein (DUF2068 family)
MALPSESRHRGAVSVMNRPAAPSAPFGERLIVFYKFGKAALEGCAGIVLWVAVAAGAAGRIVDAAAVFGRHSVHPLAVRLAHWLSLQATPTHLHVLAALLGGDALVSGAEGWVLRRGYAWGRWLVVLATSALLPLELYEILRRPSVPRAAVLVVNAAIVVYLASRARRRPGRSSRSAVTTI